MMEQVWNRPRVDDPLKTSRWSHTKLRCWTLRGKMTQQ